MKVINKIDSFPSASAFGSWFYRIVANAAYQKLRHRAHRPAEISLDDVPLFHENGQHADPITEWSASVEDPAVGTELRAALDSAIGEPEILGRFRIREEARDVVLARREL